MTIAEHRPSMEMMAHFVLTPSVRELAEHPGFKDMPLGVVPDLISDRLPTINRLKDLEAYYDRAGDRERARKLGNGILVVSKTSDVLEDPSTEYKLWYPSPALQPVLNEKLAESNTYAKLMIDNRLSPPPVGTGTKIQAIKYIAGLQIVSDQIISTNYMRSR